MSLYTAPTQDAYAQASKALREAHQKIYKNKQPKSARTQTINMLYTYIQNGFNIERSSRLRDLEASIYRPDYWKETMDAHIEYIKELADQVLSLPEDVRQEALYLPEEDWALELKSLDLQWPGTLWLSETGVAVRTDAITLEGVELGVFEIRLCLGDWTFATKALTPNYADGTENPHPHVSGRYPCLGEAEGPVYKALEEGRLADAFTLVDAMLHTYDANTPYVVIENWYGLQCSDCGERASEEDGAYCHKCPDFCCNDCYSKCQSCNYNYCANHISSCEGCGENICHRCQDGDGQCENCRREICEACEDYFAPNDLNDNNLCESCQDEKDQEKEQEEKETHEHEQQQQSVAVPDGGEHAGEEKEATLEDDD